MNQISSTKIYILNIVHYFSCDGIFVSLIKLWSLYNIFVHLVNIIYLLIKMHFNFTQLPHTMCDYGAKCRNGCRKSFCRVHVIVPYKFYSLVANNIHENIVVNEHIRLLGRELFVSCMEKSNCIRRKVVWNSN